MEFELDYAAIERGVHKILDEHGKLKLKDEKFFLACFNDYEPEHPDEAAALKDFFEAGLGNSLYLALDADKRIQDDWTRAGRSILIASGLNSGTAEKFIIAIAKAVGFTPLEKKTSPEPYRKPDEAPKKERISLDEKKDEVEALHFCLVHLMNQMSRNGILPSPKIMKDIAQVINQEKLYVEYYEAVIMEYVVYAVTLVIETLMLISGLYSIFICLVGCIAVCVWLTLRRMGFENMVRGYILYIGENNEILRTDYATWCGICKACSEHGN